MNLSNQKGFAPLLLLGLVVALITITAAGYYLIQNRVFNNTVSQNDLNSPSLYDSINNQSEGNSSVQETESWKTYQDKQFGFEIKYPERWSVSVETYSDYKNPIYNDYYQVIFISDDKEGFGKGSDKPNVPQYTLYITVYKRNEPLTLSEEARKAGEEIPQCVLGSPCEPIPPKEIVQKSNNHIREFYSVTTSNILKHSIMPLPNNTGYYVDIATWYTWPRDKFELYDQILSTFKFLDSSHNIVDSQEEINDFPGYSNSKLVTEEKTNNCVRDKDGVSICGLTKTVYETTDDYDVVSNWYRNVSNLNGWKCDGGWGEYSSPRDASNERQCEKGSLKAILMFTASSEKTEIIVNIPSESDLEVSLHFL